MTLQTEKTADELVWAVDGPPVGVWKTSSGTAEAVMQDQLDLRADGTGYLHKYSALTGHQDIPVMWRQVDPGVVKFAMLLPGDDPNDEPFWETVRYKAAMKANDVGRDVPVLQNIDDETFWNLAAPVELVSRTSDHGPN